MDTKRIPKHGSKGVARHQFPIKLTFACTRLKVQGITMESAVGSLKHIFEPGKADFALNELPRFVDYSLLNLARIKYILIRKYVAHWIA